MSRSVKLIPTGLVILCLFAFAWWFMESFPLPGQSWVLASLPQGCKVAGEDNELGSETRFFASPGTRRVEIDCDGTSHEINLTVLPGRIQGFKWKPGETDVECHVLSE